MVASDEEGDPPSQRAPANFWTPTTTNPSEISCVRAAAAICCNNCRPVARGTGKHGSLSCGRAAEVALVAFSMGEADRGQGSALAAGRPDGGAEESGRGEGGGASGGEGWRNLAKQGGLGPIAWPAAGWLVVVDGGGCAAYARTAGPGAGPPHVRHTIERALFRRVSPGESLRAPTRSTPRSPGRRRLVSISCLPCFLLPLPTPRIDRPAPSLSTARRRSSPPRSTC